MKRFLSRLYLVKCFRHHRFFFFVCIFFIGLVFYGHKTNCPITPALVIGMYTSAQQVERDSFFLITINDKETVNLYHTVDEPMRMMIFSTLTAYRNGMLAGAKDPMEESIGNIVNKHPFLRPFSKDSYNHKTAYQQYPSWLLKYMQGAVDKKIKKISVSLLYSHYNNQNLPIADSTHSLYVFE